MSPCSRARRDGEEVTPAALRKRFERLKAKLARLALEHGSSVDAPRRGEWLVGTSLARAYAGARRAAAAGVARSGGT